ncbi:MAG: pyridoxamine kinase [Clostridia bacterium]|nr:pyridoxamine kinase [Clostridia bacterium]
MDYKRILTVQDISCIGQCSLTVALPILSACGAETAVVASGVLSAHTGGFRGYAFGGLTGEMPGIAAHWKKEGLFFDAVYTGYLGSAEQIGYVLDIASGLLKKGGPLIVDPAMADGGKLYAGFDGKFVESMKQLTSAADIILPNITEAALLTGTEYREDIDEAYVEHLLDALSSGGATVVLTGVGFEPGTTGAAIRENGKTSYYTHEKTAGGCHGTGDIFASAFTGALMRGKTAPEAVAVAADFVLACIKNTVGDENHRYGVKFEPVLGSLISRLG